jgi:hypothetical protein
LPTRQHASHSSGIEFGLRENWRQFSLLVLINAFVGGMVGLERTVVPLIGSEVFKIASTTITPRLVEVEIVPFSRGSQLSIYPASEPIGASEKH